MGVGRAPLAFRDIGQLSMNNNPKCIIVTGRPGKTALAEKLAVRTCLTLLSRDAIKEDYVNTYGIKHTDLPPDTSAKVSALFFAIAAHHLSAGVSIVMEAEFEHKIWAANIGEPLGVSDPCIVLFSASGEVAVERHLERGLEDHLREHYHGDMGVDAYKETGGMAPPGNYAPAELGMPSLDVSAENGYTPQIEELTEFTGFSLPKKSM